MHTQLLPLGPNWNSKKVQNRATLVYTGWSKKRRPFKIAIIQNWRTAERWGMNQSKEKIWNDKITKNKHCQFHGTCSMVLLVREPDNSRGSIRRLDGKWVCNKKRSVTDPRAMEGSHKPQSLFKNLVAHPIPPLHTEKFREFHLDCSGSWVFTEMFWSACELSEWCSAVAYYAKNYQKAL